MRKLIICDKNKEFIRKARGVFKDIDYITLKVGDVFKQKGVMVSASNPQFTFGGGLDALILKHYPYECGVASTKKGKNQRVGNVIFTVTVGNDLIATPELVEKAIRFAVKHTNEDETLLLTGLGTGIGGLSHDLFLSILSNVLGISGNIPVTRTITTRYKFLREGFKSQYGNHTWELGKWYKHEGDISLCSNGFHASKGIYQAFSYVQGEILALVEVSGRSVEDDDKDVWESMRVVKAWRWQKSDSVALSIFAAELCIENYERLYPHNPAPREAIEAAKRWLNDPTPENGSAAASAAESAASAAWSAASAASAAWSAASAASAAWSAASAAWSAASAARSAAESAARSAAESAVVKKIAKWMDERLTVLEEIK